MAPGYLVTNEDGIPLPENGVLQIICESNGLK